MRNDIINRLETAVLKMNDQHDRFERLVFGVRLNLIVCNKTKLKRTNATKIISLNKK